MRNELAHIEEVEKYLLGDMDTADKAAFEARMKADDALAQDVALQQELMDQVSLAAFRSDMLAMHGKLAGQPQWWRNRYFTITILGLLLAMAALVGYRLSQPKLPGSTGALTERQWPADQAQPESNMPAADTAAQKRVKVPGTLAAQTRNPGQVPNSELGSATNGGGSWKRKNEPKNKPTDTDPLAGIEVSFDRFLPQFHQEVIDNDRDFTFQMADSKSFVHIPANNIVHQSGEDVKGPVEIRYREYRDAAQIAFSSIPMTYRDNNTSYNFNSAGMFELRAFQEGEELKLDPEKPIVVDYNVTEQLEDCYFFQLEDQEWKKLRKIDFNARPQPVPVKEKNDNAIGGKVKPVNGLLYAPVTNSKTGQKVEQAKVRILSGRDRTALPNRMFATDTGFISEELKPGKYSLEIRCSGYKMMVIDGIEIGLDSLSELKVKLQTTRKKKTFFEKVVGIFGKTPDDSLNAVKGSYVLSNKVGPIPPPKPVVFKRNQPLQENGQPVEFAGDSLNAAAVTPGRSATLLAEGADVGHTYPNLVKGLNCLGFGVYNCDQIYKVGAPVHIQARYVDGKGKSIENTYLLSMVDLNVNSAFSFMPVSFTCSATGRNVLLLFTADKKLYAIREEEFRNMQINNSGNYTFRMTEITDAVKTTDQLREFLGLKKKE
jgi:hypothetical protein